MAMQENNKTLRVLKYNTYYKCTSLGTISTGTESQNVPAKIQSGKN